MSSGGKKLGSTATNSPAPGCSSNALWLNNSETPKVDINTATADDLETLTGVGRAKAEAIVDVRESLGGFTCLEDLTKVPGVGTNVLDLNRPHLICSSIIGAFSSSSITPTVCSTSSSSCVLNSTTSCTCAVGTCSSMSQSTNSSCKVETNRDSTSRSRPRRRESLRELKSGSSEDQGENVDPFLPGPSQSHQSTDKETSVDDTPGSATSCSHNPSATATHLSVHNYCSHHCDHCENKHNTKETNAVQVTPVRKLRTGGSFPDRHACRTQYGMFDNGDQLEDHPSDYPSENEMDVSSEQSDEEEQEPIYMYGLEDSLQECSVAEDDAHCRNGQDAKDLGSSCDKMVMKRKSEGTPDGRGHLPGKKPCRTPERLSASTPPAIYTPQENGVTDAEINCGKSTQLSHPVRLTGAIAKKQFPTKINPPPELEEWLSIFQSWNNGERLLALNQLIETCEPSQVRHMMNVIEPQFQRDFISLLPKELALYVLSFLEPRDLLRAAQTCRYWRILAEDNLLWREKCREAGIDFVREVLGKRRVRSNSNGGCLYGLGAIQPSPWKAAYMRHHNIEMNWRTRPIRPPKVLKGHDDHVITCLQFSGNRIVSGSDDNTLKVWSATTGKCLRTLVGHTGGVWSSQMSGNLIISGSTDRTLKVWNADTGLCVHTLYGHTSTVRCMHLHGHKVVSGSRDATLRLWDIDFGECLHVLVGHVAAVRCVQYNGKLVVSGAYDYMVKVWNPEREECLHTLQGHTNRVYSLQFDGVHVVSGSLDTSIRVWDVETGACKHTLMGHQSLTSGMELRNNILVSGNADSTVKVWDILTGQCLQTLAGPNKHQSAVTCLQFNNKFVITSSDDGTVKLWDLKTGEFVRNLVALESGGSGGVVWRIRASPTKLVCAVGSRNGTEETKLLVLDFDVEAK